jgi:hypothetical protein
LDVIGIKNFDVFERKYRRVWWNRDVMDVAWRCLAGVYMFEGSFN